MTALADLPEVLTVDQVAQYLGVGRNTAYAAVGRGEIRSVKVGRRVLVPRSAIKDLLEGAGGGLTSLAADAPRVEERG